MQEISHNFIELENRKIIKDKFKNEHYAARQIAIDKPQHWEYLLILELFREKIKTIKELWNNVIRGVNYKPSIFIKEDLSIGTKKYRVFRHEKCRV